MNSSELAARGALQARIKSSRLQRLSSNQLESGEESSRESIDVGTDSTFSTTASESEFELQTATTKARLHHKNKSSVKSRSRDFSIDSLDSNYNENHWKEDLDARVKGMGILLPDDFIEGNGNASKMGPKIKMISKAPWDDLDPGMTTSTSSATLQPHNDVFDSPTTPTTPSKKEFKENLKPKIISMRARTASVLTSGSSKKTRASEDSSRGVGVNVSVKIKTEDDFEVEDTRSISSRSYRSDNNIPCVPTITTVKIRPKSPPVPLDLNRSFSSNSLAKSAPAHITSFSDLSTNHLVPVQSLPTETHSLPSSPNLTTSSLHPFPSPTLPGYKLISLQEAKQRDIDRVDAADKVRKAMMPVEYISNDPLDNNNNASNPKAIGVGVTAASIKTLKTKKSGFLKRMMGGEKLNHNSQKPGLSPEIPAVESFRSLPDDYVHSVSPSPLLSSSSTININASQASTLAPALKSPCSSPLDGEKSGKVVFTSTPQADNDQRIRKGLASPNAPSLSLRPISMAFSAGLLPTGFLETVPPPTTSTIKKTRTPTPPNILIAGNGYGDKSPNSTIASNYDTPQSQYFSAKSSSPSSIPFSNSTTSSLISPSNSQFENSFSTTISSTHGIDSSTDFANSKKNWKVMEFELEKQIKFLKLQLDGKGIQYAESVSDIDTVPCEACGHVKEVPITETSEPITSGINRGRNIKSAAGAGNGQRFGNKC